MIRRPRRLLHLLWLGPLLFLGLLVAHAGGDVRYVLRMLVRREANTDDYQWKRTATVPPSPASAPWREVPACPAVVAAFAAEPDVPGMEEYLRRGGALALLVVRDGVITCEWYGNGGVRSSPAAAFSISKVVTALLLARAVAAGKIGALEDSVATYVPELARRDARFTAVTLAALVDMRSGIAFDEDTSFPWVDGDAPRVYYASDLARTVLERTRIEAPPGRFVYNDYAPNLIGLALQRAHHAPLVAAPMQALWSELGAESPARWTVDDHGFAWHEGGLVVTARDLARLGQAMLDDGQLGGRQVLPPAFVARSFDPAGRQLATRFAGVELGYRNGWWIPGEGELLAMGRFGQLMLVSRPGRTVIVRLGHDGHDGSRGLGFDGTSETNISIGRRLQRVAARLAR